MVVSGPPIAAATIIAPTVMLESSRSSQNLRLWPQICIGGVCVPGHMILAFLLGLAHKIGLLTWIKAEW